MLTIHAPTKFQLARTDMASHSLCEAHHRAEQLAKLGKLRDRATGERRAALNDALRLMMAPRRKTAYSLGEFVAPPKLEGRP